MHHPGRVLESIGALILGASLLSGAPALAQIIPDRNVNMVAGTAWPGGDPFLQRQNEPSLAVSTRNPMHLLAGTNDYRTVDLPGMDGIEVNADAWHGVFRSYDGGQTWRSDLLPGYPQEKIAPGTPASPLRGFQAGADPVVRSGPNGMFFYSGIVLNRGANGLTAGFVARFIDHNDKEAGEPIRYVDVSLIAKGDSGQFVDKPWMAVDVPRGTGAKCTVAGQTFDAFNVYVAYSVVIGPENDQRTKLMFTRSTDCGATWSAPTKLSESEPVNQGATIAVDPSSGNVYVVWRRVSRVQLPNAILYARSTDRGLTFSKAMEVASPIDPFDQGTTGASFRTLAYPSAAIDGNGRLYVAWSERGHATGRDSRIMMATSEDGLKWSPRFPADAPTVRGHQLMPSLTFAAGKLTLVYYDLRDDSTVGEFTPVRESGGLFLEERKPVGHLAEVDPVPDHVFTEYLRDTEPEPGVPLLRRHTLDVRVAQADPAPQPVFTGARLSQYTIGSRPNSHTIEQLQFNVPNFPLFRLGSAAFMGDYIDVAAQPMITAAGGWQFATQSSKAPVFGAVWTDNRDVRPPTKGKSWSDYTPIREPNSTSVFDGTTPVPPCVPGQAGMRNQNIYFAQITKGLIAGSPGNAKQVSAGWPRAYVVFVKNTTTAVAHYRLTIAGQPAGGEASFLETQPPTPPLTTLDVSVPPRSTVARTVFVKRTDADPHTRVAVKVEQITAAGGDIKTDGLASDVILNPDIANPDIANPDIANPDIANPDIANAEVFNPDIANPDIANPDIANPDIANPDIANPDIANPDIANPDIANPDIANPDIANPDIANPDIANPDIANPDIANSSMIDTTWKLTNRGNTAAAYAVKLVLNGEVPKDVETQLIIHRVYQTPVAIGCTLTSTPNTVLLASIPDPEFISAPNIVTAASGRRAAATETPSWLKFNPKDASVKNATVALAPGDTARITLRVYAKKKEDLGKFDAAKAVAPVAIAEAINTADYLAGNTSPSISLTILQPPLMLDGLRRLADATAGAPYSASVAAIGGVGTLTWSVVSGSLPSNLTLAPDGTIAGTPSTPGDYTAVLSVTDQAHPPNVETTTVTLRVNPALVFSGPTQPIRLGQGIAYSNAFSWSGGVAPYFVTFSGSLPPGLTATSTQTSLTISGTPTIPNDYSYTVSVTDSAVPAQSGSWTVVYRVLVPLTVTITGTGAGNVTSTPAEMNCTTTCTGLFAPGTSVVLAAAANAGTVFHAWEPPFAGRGTWSTVMDAPRTVTARFDTITSELTGFVTYAGSTLVTPPGANAFFMWGWSAGADHPIGEFDPLTSKYTIYNLPLPPDPFDPHPPTFDVVITTQPFPMFHYPGSYDATGALAFFTPEQRLNWPLRARRAIHLLTPFDNTAYGPAAWLSGVYDTHGSPLHLSWEALPGAARYQIHVDRYRAAPDQWLGVEADQVVLTNSIDLPLTGTMSGEYFMLSLVAFSATDEPLGFAGVTYFSASPLSWRSELYRFLVSLPSGCLPLTLVSSPPGAGTITPTAENCAGGYTAGTQLTLTATPAAGYQLSGWKTTGGYFIQSPPYPTNPVPFVFTGASTVTATFTATNALVFSNQPSSTISGRTVTPNPIVHAQSGSTPIPGVTVTLGLRCPGRSTVGLRTAATNGSGDALFANFVVPRGGHDCVLEATSGSLSATSNAFDVYGFGDSAGMVETRMFGPTVTRLFTGDILITGAWAPGIPLATAELHDPANSGGHAIASMTIPRARHTATLPPSGRVIIAGGFTTGFGPTNSIEVYDPAAATFTTALMPTLAEARADHTATLMPDGSILFAGGVTDVGGTPLSSIERLDLSVTPATCTVVGSMSHPRNGHAAVLLGDGAVAFIGGGENAGNDIGIDIYTPGAVPPVSSGGFLTTSRFFPSVTLLDDGRILVAGGAENASEQNYRSSAEIYDPVAHTSTLIVDTIQPGRSDQWAEKLADGTVILAGGRSTGSTVDVVEIYRPEASSIEPYGSLIMAKAGARGTPAGNGFLLFGGSAFYGGELFYPERLTALLTNGSFDSDAAGWRNFGDAFDQQWSAMDSCMPPLCATSGSITHGFGIGSEVGRQRVPVTPGTKYVFRTALRSAAAQTFGMWGPVHLEFWTDYASGYCTGTQLMSSDAYLFSSKVARAGVWERDATYGTVPAGAGCVAIALTKAGSQLWFDDVFFATKPAMP